MNTPRKVTLRALEPEDLELLYTIENDCDTWDICSARVNYSRYAIKQYLSQQPQEITATGEVRLVITDSDTGEAVGLIDLTSYSATHRSAEIGITLLREQRGKGYGRSAIKAMERYAKEALNLRMIYAHTLADRNSVAKNMFLHSGYIPVAVLPEWHFCNGEYVDLTVFKKNL